MPVVLRIVLIVSSILMLIYMLKKVKKSKVQIEHTIFWIIFGVFLILISLIPQIVYLFAHLLGIQSPANLVLVFIIFILLIPNDWDININLYFSLTYNNIVLNTTPKQMHAVNT